MTLGLLSFLIIGFCFHIHPFYTQALFDQLVCPGLPVTSNRTHIHGITEDQMRGATWTLRHAQAALLSICSEHTVLVGHSVHKDLKAMRFVHTNVIDTAYLYTVEGQPGASPSLRDVSEQITGATLSDTHDSVEDARGSLYAAAMLLVHGPQRAVVRKNGLINGNGTHGDARVYSSSSTLAAGDVLPSLLIHRIPDYCSEQHIHEMLLGYTQVMPARVLPITRGPPSAPAGGGGGEAVPSGKTTVFFSSQLHCDLAFESIAGPNRPDKQNRDQKRVYFKSGGYICVRK